MAPAPKPAGPQQDIVAMLEKDLESFSELVERALEVPIGTFQAALESVPAQRSNDLRADLFKVSQLLMRLGTRVSAKAIPKD